MYVQMHTNYTTRKNYGMALTIMILYLIFNAKSIAPYLTE